MKLSFLPLPKRKIPAVVAMAFSLVSLGFFIAAAVCCFCFGFSGDDATLMWLSNSIWAAMLALVFYLVDAVISVIRAIQRKSVVFHIMMAAIVLVGVVLFGVIFFVLYVVDAPEIVSLNILTVVWYLYLLVMVVLEAVSIVKFM